MHHSCLSFAAVLSLYYLQRMGPQACPTRSYSFLTLKGFQGYVRNNAILFCFIMNLPVAYFWLLVFLELHFGRFYYCQEGPVRSTNDYLCLGLLCRIMGDLDTSLCFHLRLSLCPQDVKRPLEVQILLHGDFTTRQVFLNEELDLQHSLVPSTIILEHHQIAMPLLLKLLIIVEIRTQIGGFLDQQASGIRWAKLLLLFRWVSIRQCFGLPCNGLDLQGTLTDKTILELVYLLQVHNRSQQVGSYLITFPDPSLLYHQLLKFCLKVTVQLLCSQDLSVLDWLPPSIYQALQCLYLPFIQLQKEFLCHHLLIDVLNQHL